MTELADFPLERLSADARETMATIAPLIADGADASEVAQQLGVSTKRVNASMAVLREEMRAIRDGAQLPPLRQEDYEALRDSIATYGQLVPILTLNGDIVDGEHRSRACEELGLTPWCVALESTDATDRRAIALAVNTARRQLSIDQRRKIVTAELVHEPSASDRSIAAIAGVSHTFVQKARKELERRGLVATVATRVGVDGVSQPAKQTKRTIATSVDQPDARGDITFKVSIELRDSLLKDWSPPCQIRIEQVADDPPVWEMIGRSL